jgi:hypothetical protein
MEMNPQHSHGPAAWTGIPHGHELGHAAGQTCSMNENAARTKMQHRRKCSIDENAAWTKMQHGRKCSMDENAAWTKMQH